MKVCKFSWRTRYKYKRWIMSIQNTRPQWYSFYITAIRLRYLRILVLSNCQKRDPLPLSDPSRSQIQSQDRRHPWHPVLSGQLVLQHFWSERYVHKSNNEPIRRDMAFYWVFLLDSEQIYQKRQVLYRVCQQKERFSTSLKAIFYKSSLAKPFVHQNLIFCPLFLWNMKVPYAS